MTAERDEEILRLMDEPHCLSGKAIAERLGMSQSAVSRAWRRALARRDGNEELDDDWDELTVSRWRVRGVGAG